MISASQIPIRNYNRLYLGSNEQGGYESPFLSFGTESKKIVFAPDSVTRFVYPEYAFPEQINVTELIEDGAAWGNIPEHADRIKTSSDCLETGAYSMYDRYGAWAFTWLSGNGLDPNQTPIWIDRWYNPLYRTEQDALESLAGVDGIYDFPSRLRFLPNRIYEYYHYGSKINNDIVQRFDSNLNLYFDNWNEVTKNQSQLHDVSAVLVNFDDSMISNDIVDIYALIAKNEIYNEFKTDSSLKFSRNKYQYAYISSNESHNLSGDYTCTFWTKKDNWLSGPSCTIASHGFRSGWNIKFNNGFPPIVTSFIDTDLNTLLVNTQNIIYNNINISKSTVINAIDFTMDNDYYLFSLFEDTDNKVSIHKIDMLNGLVVRKYTFDFLSPSNTYKVLLSPSEDLYIVSADTLYSIDTNLTGPPISLRSAFGGSQFSTFDLNGTLTNENYITIFDEKNNRWQIIGGNICRNTIPIFIHSTDEYQVSDIKIDSNNKLWALFTNTGLGKAHLKKYDINLIDQYLNDDYRYLQYLVELQTSDINVSVRSDFIISRDPDNTKNIIGIFSDVDKKIYYYNENESVSFENKRTDVFLYSLGDPFRIAINNYDWNRKFNYIKHNKKPTLQLNVYTKDKTVRLAQNSVIRKYSFNLPCEQLIDTGGWHHIAFDVNTTNNFITFFVDTILTDKIEIEQNQSMACIYDCPLILGTAAGPILDLARELKDNTAGFFNGYIDDFRLYNTNIIIDNTARGRRYIERIYLEKFTYYPLHWNIRVPETFYVEEIQQFFKFKPPGSKSQLFNIKIRGLKITNEITRLLIESIIKDSLKKTIPHYTNLYKIIWE